MNLSWCFSRVHTGEGIADHTLEKGNHQFPKEAVISAHPLVPYEGSGFTGSC